MKFVLISIFFVCFSIIANAQNFFKADVTELHKYDKENEKWELFKKDSDLDIDVVLEDCFITILAKSPNMYRLDTLTKEKVSGKTFSGVRFEAVRLRDDTSCIIDLIHLEKKNTFVLSIFLVDMEYNLRYFLKDIKGEE